MNLIVFGPISATNQLERLSHSSVYGFLSAQLSLRRTGRRHEAEAAPQGEILPPEQLSLIIIAYFAEKSNDFYAECGKNSKCKKQGSFFQKNLERPRFLW